MLPVRENSDLNITVETSPTKTYKMKIERERISEYTDEQEAMK